ncbi:hypothetical protein ABTD56_18465, partial [Acinetobacter baumannii]
WQQQANARHWLSNAGPLRQLLHADPSSRRDTRNVASWRTNAVVFCIPPAAFGVKKGILASIN